MTRSTDKPDTTGHGDDLASVQVMTREQLRSLVHRLPVFPQCAAEVIRAARDGCISAEQLIHLTGYDQVLGGSLIAAANGAAYTWSGSVRTIESAVLYLGEVRATQVLLSAALKPILAVSGHQELWEHSLDVAHIANRIAAKTRRYDPSDAYVLGLLHDIGDLLLKLLPVKYANAVAAMVAKGCSHTDAQIFVYGATHAQAGADVLRHWGLPADYVQAIEHHHEPEKCEITGASVLYLAEHWTNSGGDTLCPARLEHAMKTLNLTSLDAPKESEPEPARPSRQW